MWAETITELEKAVPKITEALKHLNPASNPDKFGLLVISKSQGMPKLEHHTIQVAVATVQSAKVTDCVKVLGGASWHSMCPPFRR